MNVFDLYAKLSLDSSAYESGLKSAKNLAGTIGGGISSGLATAAKVGMAAVTAATTAMVGFGASAVKTGAEFDKSMSQVAATLGLTMDEMANETGKVMLTVNGQTKEFEGTLREFAQEMGKNTAFSATQAADALNYMALAGYDAQTSMEMLPTVLNLAAAGNMDLARASDMVTDAATAFGMVLEDGTVDIERTTLMVDEMAKAASTGNTSVEQLGDAFLTVGGLAKELNGGMVTLADGTTKETDGIQELEIALTAMANAGIKGSEAGTHMRNMLLKLSSPTEAGVKQLDQLGVKVFDADGKMRSLKDIMGDLSGAMGELTQEQKLQAISDLFNTRDTASAEALLAAVAQDWDKIGAEILDAQGAAQKMADTQLDNLAGDVTLFKSALEGAKIAVSDVLSPALREFVQFGTKGLSELTDAFQKDGLNGAMAKFGELLSEGLNMVIEKLPDFINGGIQLVEALGKGIMDNLSVITNAGVNILGQLGKAFADNLPTVIDAGLTILEALLKAFSENIDKILDAVKKMVKGIGDAFSKHGPEIMKMGLFIIETLFNSLIDNLPTIMKFVITMVEKIKEWVSNNLDKIVDSAIALIETLAQTMVENLPEIIKTTVELVKTIMETLTDPTNLQMIITAGVEVLMTLVKSLANSLPELIPVAVDAIVTIVGALIDNVDQLVDAAIEIIMALAEGLIDSLPTLIEKAPEIVEKLVSAIIENAPKLIESAVELVAKLVAGIVENWPEMIEAGKDLVTKLGEGIIEMYGELSEMGGNITDKIFEGFGISDKVPDWGRDFIKGFIDGITGQASFDRIREGMSTVADWVRQYIHFSEPDVGPLSDFHTYAPDMMKMYSSGILDNINMVEDAASEAADAVYSGFSVSPTSTATYQVSTASGSVDSRLDGILAMLQEYMPSYATAEDMENMSINVDNREFGRLVREVG